MGMKDHILTFTYIVQQLRALNIVLLKPIEARIQVNDDNEWGGNHDASLAVHAWRKEAHVMVGGGFNGES